MNDTITEILPYDKNRFYPFITKKDIMTLVDIFCVGGLCESGCFRTLNRSIKLTKKAKQVLQITNNNYTIDDINSLMKGRKVLVVMSDKDCCHKYTIYEAIFISLNKTDKGYSYDNTSCKVDIDGDIIERVTLKRVFISIRDVIMSFPLDYNKSNFIPNKF